MTTDFEAGWPVIDSDFKWMLQRLRCLLREPNGEQNRERSDEEVWRKPFRSFLNFYARVQALHLPDRQKHHSNPGPSTSLPTTRILPLQRGRSHTQLCTSHTLINLLYLRAGIDWSKRQGKKKKPVCCSVPWSVGSLAQRRDVSVAWKSKPASQRQSEAPIFVCEHFFAVRRLESFDVLAKWVWPNNRCSQCLHEASWGFFFIGQLP